MTIVRKDQFLVTLSVDGVSYGVWDMWDGGEVDSSEKKYSPGGMGEEITIGGKRTTGNITLTRAMDNARDAAQEPVLKSRAGRGAAVVTKQLLDADKLPFGAPIVDKGVLKKYTPGTHDSNGTDETPIVVEISTSTTS